MAELAVTNEAQHDQRFSRYVLPELEALLRRAMSLTHQPADTEDLVQDTVLRAYRSIDQFSGEYPRARHPGRNRPSSGLPALRSGGFGVPRAAGVAAAPDLRVAVGDGPLEEFVRRLDSGPAGDDAAGGRGRE